MCLIEIVFEILMCIHTYFILADEC